MENRPELQRLAVKPVEEHWHAVEIIKIYLHTIEDNLKYM